MFLVSSAVNFVKQRKRALLTVAGGVGGVWLLGKWVKNKMFELQEKAALERTAKENIRRRFEQNQQDCMFTVLALLPSIGDQILPALNVEEITARLQETRRTPASLTATGDRDEKPKSNHTATRIALGDFRSKNQLWNDLKIISITRAMTCVYLVALVTLLTHLQLNLLGRFYYVESVLSFPTTTTMEDEEARIKEDRREPSLSAKEAPTTVSYETQREYLSFSWWLLNEGWKLCEERVLKAVKESIGETSLGNKCTYGDIEMIIYDIRSMVEHELTEEDDYGECRRVLCNVRSMLLPDHVEDERKVLERAGSNGLDGRPEDSDEEWPPQVSEELSKLLMETRDFIDGPDFECVAMSVFDACFSVLFDHIHAQFFQSTSESPSTDTTTAPSPTTNSSSVDKGPDAHAKIRELAPGENPVDAIKDKKVPLAALLPFFSRQAHHVINGVPNEYLERLEHCPDLQAFSAIIYSSFDTES